MNGPEHYARAEELLAMIEAAGQSEEGADSAEIQTLAAVAGLHLRAAEVAAAVLNGEATASRLSWLQAVEPEGDSADAVTDPLEGWGSAPKYKYVRECPECGTRWGVNEPDGSIGCPVCSDNA